MKVIGKTSDGILISSTEQEVANLIGYYWTGVEGCPRIECGMQIKVAEMYNHLQTLKRNEKELGQIATKLRAVADVLELNSPIVDRLVERKDNA